MLKNLDKIIWPKIGNDRAVEFLNRSLLSNKISQTYVFAGEDDLGKSTIALALARNLLLSDEKSSIKDSLGQDDFLSINSDLHILEPLEEKKNISIEQVRELIRMLNLSSFLNSYKIGIIKEAHRLSEEAKNALLKTLEEPQEKVIIILLINNEDNLPKTILSRSQILYFQSVPTTVIYDYLLENYKINRSLAKDLASLSLGKPLKAIRLVENQEVYNSYLNKARKILELFGSDANGRLKLLDEVFFNQGFSQSAVQEAGEVLAMMEGLLRDLLLLNLNQPDRIQHSALSTELIEIKTRLDRDNSQDFGIKIINKLKLIDRAKQYLASNVNPRLSLEQVVINL